MNAFVSLQQLIFGPERDSQCANRCPQRLKNIKVPDLLL